MLQKISGLFKGLTNVSGIPNLEVVESYLQQLENIDDRTLNTIFAYMQNNESTIQESLQRSPGESFPVLNLTTILENVIHIEMN